MKSDEIESYLDKLIPTYECELNYNHPYELLLSVMLSAQCTDKRVNEVTSKLYKKYDTLEKLNELTITQLEYYLKPLGFYKVKASNFKNIVSKILNNEDKLNNRQYLESLPGVGRKSANVVLNHIYKEDVVAVDTHVQRVSKRLGIANDKDTPLEIENKIYKYFKNSKSKSKVGNQILLFGRYYCKSINPNCDNCLFKSKCKYK